MTEERIQQFRSLRFGMFVCWSFSTFANVEYTRGVKGVSWFNPTGFDPVQWARTAREAGMRYILLLTKHHDGFCLWDTDTTDWKVTKSPLRRDVGPDRAGRLRDVDVERLRTVGKYVRGELQPPIANLVAEA